MLYKLYYFNTRGYAEPIRMILTYGGAEFEDIRAPFTEIPAVLPHELTEKCTWGQVPLIEFDGKKLCQSLAISRYLAKQFNLVPEDDFEAALCDEYVDASRDYLACFLPLIMETDEVKLKELLAEVLKTTGDRFLKKFQDILVANGGQRLVGKKFTWADIYLAYIFNTIEIVNEVELLKGFPALKSFYESVLSVPQLKAWIQKRPNTRF